MEKLSCDIKFTFDPIRFPDKARKSCYKLLDALYVDFTPPLLKRGVFTPKEDANYYTVEFETDIDYSLAKGFVFCQDLYVVDIEDLGIKGLGIEEYRNITVIKDNIRCTKENFYTLYPAYYKKTIRIDGVSKEIETIYLEDLSEINDWKLPVNNLGNDDQAMEDFNKIVDMMQGIPHLVRTRRGTIKKKGKGAMRNYRCGYDVRFTQNAAELTIVGTEIGSCRITYKPPHLKKFKDELRTKQVM